MEIRCSGFGSFADNSKDSLLIVEKFLDAKELRTLQGANQNSSLRSSDSDLLGSKCVVIVPWLKFQDFFANYLLNEICLKILMLAIPNPFARWIEKVGLKWVLILER